MQKLIMMSAPSASGKTTLAKELMVRDPNAVRINRDDLRAMSILKWTPAREGWVIEAEIGLARAAAACKRNIIIDDTNLMPRDETRWRTVAIEIGYEFVKKQLTVDIEDCVARDSERTGAARVGRPTIERQFLKGGLINWPDDKDVVIFDIDGTLADLEHRVPWITPGADCPNCMGRGFVTITGAPVASICSLCKEGKIVKKNHDMFYSSVNMDSPIHAVVRWIQHCYEHFYVLIVSGRAPEKCGEETVTWLYNNDIPFDHIIMRRSNMHGPDDEEKQLILNDILKTLPKEKIAFVVDDRPNVVAMWRRNGIRVFPVRGRDDAKFYELEKVNEGHAE